MKAILIITVFILLIGCNHHVYFHRDQNALQDTLIIRDTVNPDIIIIRDTLQGETVYIHDTILTMPLNPWPGMILPFDRLRKDTIYRVWLQWGFMGPWHQYILDNTCR